MIVFLSSPWRTAALTVAVLLIAAWVIDGHHLPHPHLPSGLLHALAALMPATVLTPPCHCGLPIPPGRIAYCSDRCRWADDCHGPDHDPEVDA